MPVIQRGDLVNKTDETITLEPGESIEVETTQVGREIRINNL